MEVASGAANFIAILECIYKIGVWAKDTKIAETERQKLLDGLGRLDSVIKSIEERVEDARAGDEWYEGLLEMIRSSGKLSSDGKYEPNPNQTSETALSRLYVILHELSAELGPAQGWKKYSQSFHYHWDKNRFEALLREFAKCQKEISFLLDHDHFKLSKAIREDGRETLVHVSEIHSRVTAIEHSQKRQEEHQKRQEEQMVKQQDRQDELDREAFEKWLSPIEFQATQEQIIEHAFGTGKWFFDSLIFRHWVKGKPWHLRIHGAPGSGKVRDLSPFLFSCCDCF
jgi:hypothetical protein